MCEGEAERRVRMHAGPDRVGLLREEVEISTDDDRFKRPEIRPPSSDVGVIPAIKFLDQLQEPGPAVGTLERPSVGVIEVVGLGEQVLGCQVGIERRSDLGGLGEVGEKTE